MHQQTGSLVQTLLGLPIFQSEWVLYLLIGLSVISIGVILERWSSTRATGSTWTPSARSWPAPRSRATSPAPPPLLEKRDALETNVVLVGLRAYDKGPESVEDLIAGALGREKARYEKRLELPGHAGQQRARTSACSARCSASCARSATCRPTWPRPARRSWPASPRRCIATAVGLLVAIPAVIAFNVFKGRVKDAVTDGADAGAHPAVAASSPSTTSGRRRIAEADRHGASSDDAARTTASSPRSTSSRSSTSCWCCWSSSC